MRNLQKQVPKKGAENVLVDLNAEAEDIEHIQAFAQSLVDALA